MLFPSEMFIFVFLPIVVVIYYGLLRKNVIAKNIFLLIASLFFYAWGRPKHLLIMLCSIVMNYFFGILIDKNREKKILNKWILGFMVACNLGILGIFKYLGFTVEIINYFLQNDISVHTFDLPIGISFFTFQAMSYVIDVYRNDGKVQKNPLYVGLYISLFPQLVAGPIVRYETIADQIENRIETREDFNAGVTRFCIGLAKKVLIANNMAIIADGSYDLLINNQYNGSVVMAWFGAIAYIIQLYFDFSSYSDMAIGLGKMFGFKFNENFNYPYIAANVTDFWRRWHISMGSWFRDYVYIPLGGSRGSKARVIFNSFVVWFLTGLWHGANWTYICWGLTCFVFLMFEKYTGINKKNTWWTHLYTLIMFVLSCVVFRAETIADAGTYLKAMFGFGTCGFVDTQVWAYFKQHWIYVLASVPACCPILPYLEKKYENNKIWNVAFAIVVLILFFVSISYIANNAYNPFIYFNF